MSTNDHAALSPLDTAALAQLANQIFSAAPGQAPVEPARGTPHGLPPGLSHLSAHSEAGAGSHPLAVQNVPPSRAATGAHTGGLPGTSAYEDVPSVPRVAAPGHVPQSFGGELQHAAANPVSPTQGVRPQLTLNPLDWGLPSDEDLRELLSPRSPARSAHEAPGSAPAPSFYFIGAGPDGFTPRTHGVHPPFDVNLVRRDFPVLREHVNGKPLIWLDNAATTHKPQSVIDRIAYFYAHENSNIHRAAHALAARATDAYEAAREKVRGFVNARSVSEIVFVRGTTEAINLVAKSWGEAHVREGDEIVVSHLEHHANIVPWQQLCARTGGKLRVIPVDEDGQIRLDEYAKLLGPRTRLVSFTQVSNALGTVTPARQMVAMARSAGARVLVDGAQSVSHMRTDVLDLDCDWFVFSGHKVFGPTGIGVLYGKEALLNETPPWQGGGNMIRDVTFEHTQYHDAPGRFEAGTGNIADAVGLGAAIDYVQKLGIDRIGAYEHHLLQYATNLLGDIPGLRLIGTAPDKAAVLSFTLQGYQTEEVGKALNDEGIAVRSGHHCAQPILRRFGVEATVRPSLAFYNTCREVDALVGVLHRLAARHR
ncbi:family 2A encapsulin nanocompartment cargo protein cysteine desulfurase [Aquabacterium sp.]|uniref:family 2A encapsulin nanocompartment cargo protein cysteine desulfurase n=1 Tax=Aquabacterium sp. TaxID=1872578 RepID=UPI0035C6E25C